MLVSVEFKLSTKSGLVFGPGQIKLLRLIQEHGSLLKASKIFGISYRSAWGKIKNTEQSLGFSLLEKTGSDKSGYSLTVMGEKLLQNCADAEKRFLSVAEECNRDIFAEFENLRYNVE